MGYTKDTIKGVSWLGAFRIASRFISLGRTAIVARLITPAQFGVFGIVGIVLSITEILTETGINIFLVQKKGNIDSYISTAWIVSILRGVLITGLIIATAPLLETFFEIDNLFSYLLLASSIPFVRGFINPSVAKFVKELQFNKEFLYRVSIFTVESVVTIILVYLWPTVESLILGLLAGAFYEVILSFFLASPKPIPQFKKKLFLEVIHRGKWLTASGVFNYLFQNIDNVVIGKILGAASLGLYDMAYRISQLPITEVTTVVEKATFPVYVKIAEDKSRLKKAFTKSVLITSAVVIPISLVFLLIPDVIVSVVLGEQWLEAATILQVLALLGMLKALMLTVNALIIGVNKQEMLTIINFVSFVVLASVIIPFTKEWGLVGAGYAGILSTLVTFPIVIYCVYTIFKVKKSQ